MLLWKLLTPKVGAKQVETIANEIARRAQLAVWDRVEHRVTTMRLAEARGYVRARAAAVIEHEADLALLARPGFDAAIRARVIAEATDKVISLSMRSLLPLRFGARTNRQAA